MLKYPPGPKYQPGQALRHGAPCFRVAGPPAREVAHVIGTKEDCLPCQRYRDNLGVTLEQALAICNEGDLSDIDHKCLACFWRRCATSRR